jgi:hypothetical protein
VSVKWDVDRGWRLVPDPKWWQFHKRDDACVELDIYVMFLSAVIVVCLIALGIMAIEVVG